MFLALDLRSRWINGLRFSSPRRRISESAEADRQNQSSPYRMRGYAEDRLNRQGEQTVLRYYREAPILEESQPVGKASISTIRHGCWATVVLADDRVVTVHYRFVPASFDASNDCEDIFDACVP